MRCPGPLGLEAVRSALPREQWPRTRTCTVRAWDPDALEMTLDFVHHGDEGLAGPWAARAEPGDGIRFMGPGGGYAPDPAPDWHLLAGDESALLAVAAAVESLPAGARALVLVGSRTRARSRSCGPRRTPGSSGCTAATGRSARHSSRPSPRSTSRPATYRSSCTARRRSSRNCGATCGWTGACRASGCRSRDNWRRGADEDGRQASKREGNAAVEREQEGGSAA